MPQAPTVVGPTGQASRIDHAIIQQRAANQAGGDMRYETYKYIEPERTKFGDGLFTFDTYIPKQKDISISERPKECVPSMSSNLRLQGGARVWWLAFIARLWPLNH